MDLVNSFSKSAVVISKHYLFVVQYCYTYRLVSMGVGGGWHAVGVDPYSPYSQCILAIHIQ